MRVKSTTALLVVGSLIMPPAARAEGAASAQAEVEDPRQPHEPRRS